MIRYWLPVVVLLFLLTGCERTVLPPLPDGVPEGARYDRRHRLWVIRSSDEELAFYADGKPAHAGQLNNGVREGRWVSYAPDGTTVTTSGIYRKGRRDGQWVHRDDTGRLYVQIGYAPEPADPVLSAVSRETGNENGPFKRYYPDGSVELTGAYRAGRFHGHFRRYGRNGKMAYEGQYVNGQKEGLWKIYDSTGQLQREEHYAAGRLQGAFRIFRNGRLAFETVYKDGKEIGPRRYTTVSD